MATTMAYGFSTLNDTNSSFPNTTFTPTSPDPTYFKGDVRVAAIVLGVFNTITGILVNLTVMVSVLTDKELRANHYFWNIISLNCANIIASTTVVPFSTNIFHVGKWVHGSTWCKAFIFSDYTQLPLAATILICTNINRFAEMVTSPTSTLWFHIAKNQKLRMGLTVAPWVYTAIYIPLLVLAEKKEYSKTHVSNNGNVCYYRLKNEFEIPLVVVMFAGPLFTLLILSIISLGIYIKWVRGMADGSSLKMSMPSTILMGFMYGFSWLPFAVAILRSYGCDCFPSKVIYMLTICSTCASPVLSGLAAFLNPNIRGRVREVAGSVRNWCCGYLGKDGKIAVKWVSGDPQLLKASESVPSEF